MATEVLRNIKQEPEDDEFKEAKKTTECEEYSQESNPTLSIKIEPIDENNIKNEIEDVIPTQWNKPPLNETVTSKLVAEMMKTKHKNKMMENKRKSLNSPSLKSKKQKESVIYIKEEPDEINEDYYMGEAIEYQDDESSSKTSEENIQCDVVIEEKPEDGEVASDHTYQCALCPEIFLSKDDLQAHFSTHNICAMDLIASFQCSLCPDNFSTKEELQEHLSIHTTLKAYSCKYCNEEFTIKVRFDDHMYYVHNKKSPHVCEICGARFMSKYRLSNHIRTHTGEKPYICTICSNKFSHKQNLHRHIAIVHNKDKPFKCESCPKSFFDRYTLTEHTYTHTGEKPFPCTLCEKKFTNRYDLKRHVLNFHTQEDLFSCKLCNKNFTKTNDLKKHLLIHTGERPHKCTECKATFRQKCHLSKHMIVHQKNLPKNFPCTICHKRFVTNDGCRKHMMSHSTDKPYKCEICSKAFNQNYYLNRHLKKVHYKKALEALAKDNKLDVQKILSETSPMKVRHIIEESNQLIKDNELNDSSNIDGFINESARNSVDIEDSSKHLGNGELKSS